MLYGNLIQFFSMQFSVRFHLVRFSLRPDNKENEKFNRFHKILEIAKAN